jgi:hypothetical protein
MGSEHLALRHRQYTIESESSFLIVIYHASKTDPFTRVKVAGLSSKQLVYGQDAPVSNEESMR